MTVPTALKVISLNIEGQKHLSERVLPFLDQEQADVVCLQEVFAVDLPVLERETSMKANFVPLTNINQENSYHQPQLGLYGIAILTNLPCSVNHKFYVGSNSGKSFTRPEEMDRALLWIEAEKDGQQFIIANTHFTWSFGGEFTDLQARDFKEMEKVLDELPEIILCGDFNSPRKPGEKNIFAELAERYTDNIPPEVTSTLDHQLHKAGPLDFVVDGIFTSPEYTASEVRVVDGISDHRAIVAEISKSS